MTDRRRSRVPMMVALAVFAVSLVVGGAAAVWLTTGDGDASGAGQELVIEVPAGTQDRIEAGEEVELIPRELELEVGDTLTIENRDDALHQVGPYTVGPLETLTQTFQRSGTVQGLCSLHPSGQVTIIVR